MLGVLAAVLKAEWLLLSVKETKRLQTLDDITAFNKAMQKLVKSKVCLPDDFAKREAAKSKA